MGTFEKVSGCFEVYNYHFPDSENINISIADITDEQFAEMNADMIVGGFHVKTTLWLVAKRTNKVLKGQRVSFREIIRATRIIRPRFLILENVDRLLKAPSKQRGRDFAIYVDCI